MHPEYSTHVWVNLPADAAVAAAAGGGCAGAAVKNIWQVIIYM